MRLLILFILAFTGVVVGIIHESSLPLPPSGINVMTTRLGTDVYIDNGPITEYGIITGFKMTTYGKDGFRDKLILAESASYIKGVWTLVHPRVYRYHGAELLSVARSDIGTYDDDVVMKGHIYAWNKLCLSSQN